MDAALGFDDSQKQSTESWVFGYKGRHWLFCEKTVDGLDELTTYQIDLDQSYHHIVALFMGSPLENEVQSRTNFFHQPFWFFTINKMNFLKDLQYSIKFSWRYLSSKVLKSKVQSWNNLLLLRNQSELKTFLEEFPHQIERLLTLYRAQRFQQTHQKSKRDGS